jgi:clan AA aspartic protease (TIGR02281 family)
MALGLAVLTLASTASARKERVPIEGRGNVLIISATINQRASGRFMLDTGATYCVVSKDFASEANLSGRKDGRKVRMATASGQLVEVTVGEARRIDVGDAVAREVDVAVMDRDPVPGLQGIIGLSFLQHFKYSVDSKNDVLLLED